MKLRVIAILASLLAPSASALAATAIGLTADGKLVTFDTERRRAERTVTINGTEGRALGIDIRPADGKLYLFTDRNLIYTIDPATGSPTRVTRLTQDFVSGGRAVVDFNPAADRLRLLGLSGQSFRIVPDTGQVFVDGTLKFAPNDRLASRKPAVVAGAYTNSMAGARGTELFDIDSSAGALLLQNPPNDGVLQTKGMLGAKLGRTPAFDILVDGETNWAFAVDGGTLYSVDLATGAAKAMGRLSGVPALIDMALVPIKR